MKRIALALLAIPFAAPPAYAGGGCHTGAASALEATSTIVVDHACFGTGAARVAVGKAVTWRNTSPMQHNVSGPGVAFGELPMGGTYSLTFSAPGLYPYACTLHPGMSGVLVVGDVPGVVPVAAAAPVAPAPSGGGGFPAGPVAAGAVAVAVAAGAVVVSLRRREPLPA